MPLTTIAKEVGCSVAMLDRHYAGVLADWDGRQIPAAKQIQAARKKIRGRVVDVNRPPKAA